MSTSFRACTLVVMVTVACGTSEPRFGSLVADARRLNVRSEVQIVELTNGMTVAMAPDRRTNLVTVDVRYLVGSADDPDGRAGMAHLMEHLAFQFPWGTSGATLFGKLSGLTLGFNAYTSKDITHFTATALADRIDALIEVEGQRLEARCDAIDDATFARERDVVMAEEAERRSPLRDVIGAVDAEVWGAGHPYARPVGSPEIAGVTKAEACAFFDAHYAPDRAVMVVTGNFEPAALQQRIGLRYGPMTKKATAKLVDVPRAKLEGGESRHRADVDHPIALIYLPAPSWGAPDEALHDMLAVAMGDALRGLDAEADWVVSATVQYAGAGRRRVLVIAIEVAAVADLERAVEAALARGRELFQDDDRDGHHDDDDDEDDLYARAYLAWVRGRIQTATVRHNDRMEGRGAWLADFMTYAGHYEFMLANLQSLEEVTGEALVARARELFDRTHSHVALIEPSGTATSDARALVASVEPGYDLVPWRTVVDPAEAARALSVPKGTTPLSVDDFRFDNGLRVLLYADVTSPVVDARMIYPAGAIDDDPDRRGTAVLAAALLSHDYQRWYSDQARGLIYWATTLGTQVTRSAGARSTVFGVRGLSALSDWHTWRLSWLLDQGVYKERDVASAHRDEREAEGGPPPSAAALEFRRRLYGAGHPFAAAAPTVDELARVTAADLKAWRRDRYATQGATLIVTGGFKRTVMRKVVRELFGPWRATEPAARAVVPAIEPAAGPSWIRSTSDRGQVALYVSFAASSDPGRDRAARLVLAEMIDDRLRVVREGMGASYGVQVHYNRDDGGVELAIEMRLDPARAPAAAAATMAELTALRTGVAALPSDFARARRRVFSRALATRTDATSVADELTWMVENELTLAQTNGLAAAVGKLTPAQVAAVARMDLDPARRVVMVEGAGAPVAATLEALGATGVASFAE